VEAGGDLRQGSRILQRLRLPAVPGQLNALLAGALLELLAELGALIRRQPENASCADCW
jgi:hypothetical protein